MEETKKCSKCNEIKPISDFSPNGENKIRSNCKQCGAKIARERRHKNQQQYNLERRLYNAALPEEKKEQKRLWHRNYYNQHRKELIKNKVEEHKLRMGNDPVYARKKQLQSIVNRMLHRGQTPNEKLKNEIEKILGCSIPFFITYFFDTWEKRYKKEWSGEKFEIDHIVPLNNAKTIQDVEKLFHYKNLQCLTPFDNKNKYIN